LFHQNFHSYFDVCFASSSSFICILLRFRLLL
jgi:hypothetical protein